MKSRFFGRECGSTTSRAGSESRAARLVRKVKHAGFTGHDSSISSRYLAREMSGTRQEHGVALLVSHLWTAPHDGRRAAWFEALVVGEIWRFWATFTCGSESKADQILTFLFEMGPHHRSTSFVTTEHRRQSPTKMWWSKSRLVIETFWMKAVWSVSP